jgi:hypothetical protein
MKFGYRFCIVELAAGAGGFGVLNVYGTPGK